MFPPALVLTAGLGTRLRPLSLMKAKPALPVAGRPLVEHILRWLRGHGIADAVLNLHHLPDSVAAAVGDGNHLGMRVRYSWEQPLLGSGGGIARAFTLLDGDDLLVVNGDTLTDVDLASLVAAHRSSGALVTMAVVEHPRPDRYGGVRVDADGSVLGFVGRNHRPAPWHFIGVQVVSRRAFEAVATDAPSESVGAIYPALVAHDATSVRAWRTAARFDDIGTPRDYLETCQHLARGADRALVDPAAAVSQGATIEGTVVWAGATVEPEVVLTECIVADGARVARGSRYHRAVLIPAGVLPSSPGDRRDGDLLVIPIA